MAELLNYDLNIKTPYSIALFLLTKGIALEDELSGTVLKGIVREDFLESIEDKIILYTEIGQYFYTFQRYSALAVTAAAIACGRLYHGLSAWNDSLSSLCGL